VSQSEHFQSFGIDFSRGWLADRIGRINGTLIGAIFALVGGALQAASTSADFILIARVVTGLGTGALTAIIPVYVAETSTSTGRGKFLGLVFIANVSLFLFYRFQLYSLTSLRSQSTQSLFTLQCNTA
jgi:MFS family permease